MTSDGAAAIAESLLDNTTLCQLDMSLYKINTK